MSKRNFSDDQVPQVVADYESGLSSDAIGAKYGASGRSVLLTLKRAGVDLRPAHVIPKVIGDEAQREMRRLYESGASVRKISIASGYNPRHVRRVLGISQRPQSAVRGEGHHSWKGGRTVTSGGYTAVKVTPDDPMFVMANKRKNRPSENYVLEHRLVMARALGRPLEYHETVHHIDGDITHNDLSNLQLRFGRHGKGVAMRCNACGSHDIKAAPLANVNSTTPSAT